MQLSHLSLKNFRNYPVLEFEPPPGAAIFHGANAQGKTNLLEAVYLLATTRPSRNAADRDLIYWAMAREPMPFARIAGTVERADRKVQLEIILMLLPSPPSPAESEAAPPAIRKHLRVNGTDRRVTDFIGHLNVVLFGPRDVDLVSGEPALRRRYLDMTNSQISSKYLAFWQRYSKVIERRNHLLRRIGDSQAKPSELDFWDEELIRSGAFLLFERQRCVAELGNLSRAVHARLTGGQEELTLRYRPNVGPIAPEFQELTDAAEALTEALTAARPLEIQRGVSLIGPHRDELRFIVNGVDIGTFGSRGQQRTAALSLKLAEAAFMRARTGEAPVLLLDDVLSELDQARRNQILMAVFEYHQVWITATDLDRFPPEFLNRAQAFQIENGAIASGPTGAPADGWDHHGPTDPAC